MRHLPLLALLACSSADPTTDTAPAVVSCGPETDFPDEVLGAGEEPPTSFSLDDALVDLPSGDGPLRAIITVPQGDIVCTFKERKAPNGVANFIGLARGVRAWLDPASGEWVRRPFYDGLIFHRIIDDFMVQGGDPEGTGMGGPGYALEDEIENLVHEPGTLAYANSGANTSGSQFYITEVATDWLDGGYTILGYCEPLGVIEELAAVPTDDGDVPLLEVSMQVEITRCPLE